MTTTTYNPYEAFRTSPRYGWFIPGTDRESNGYHDSYFSASSWDPTEGKLVNGEYGATAFPSPTTIPADGYIQIYSDEARPMIEWMRGQVIRRHERYLEAEALTINKGDQVTIHTPVTRGKNKTAAGATGTVGWIDRQNVGLFGVDWTYGIDLDGETQEWNGRTKARRVFVKNDATDRVALTTPRPVDYSTRDALAERIGTDPVRVLMAWLTNSYGSMKEVKFREWLVQHCGQTLPQ